MIQYSIIIILPYNHQYKTKYSHSDIALFQFENHSDFIIKTIIETFTINF
jgi:hypothetical protein